MLTVELNYKLTIITKLNRIITVAAFVLLSIQATAQTKIIAHRGFSSVAPENTLVAFQKAIECKADYFELDVHKTKNDSIGLH